MKKRSTLLITLLVVALLSTLSMPVNAGPPTTAGGEWQYIVTGVDVRVAGCNTFIYISKEDSIWQGTFQGTSTDTGVVVEHCSGKASFNGIVSFVGEVNGESGSLEMSVTGQYSYEQGDWNWKGQWVILSGTEGLANLHGQGTWFGPGAGGPFVWGTVDYAGSYRFEPE
jgi:hypothetical protein